jgi:hypothetical protein
MTVRIIKILNKKILNLLKNLETKDFDENNQSFARGFDPDDYDAALRISVDNKTLIDFLEEDKPIMKLKYNSTIGETEAGSFFSENMRQLMDFDDFYTSAYIPKGFDRWHEDSDMAIYVMLFTYSKEGNGYLKYKLPQSPEIITIQDEPGWNVRGMINGNTKETHVWHCVASDGFRATFILLFNTEDKYNKAVEFLMRA